MARTPRSPRSRRLLRFGKWTGLVLSVLVAAVWVVSGWVTCCWLKRWPGRPSWRVSVGHGILVAGTGFPVPPRETGSLGVVLIGTADSGPTPRHPRFPFHGPPGWIWWAFAVDLNLSGVSRARYVELPLWFPFLVLALPTAFLWWRDRRPRPGFCRCGYDLKGLEGRPCPECGMLQSRAAAEQP